MAKLKVNQFPGLEAAKDFYLNQVDLVCRTNLPPDRLSIYEAKYQAAKENDWKNHWVQSEAEALGVSPEEVIKSI